MSKKTVFLWKNDILIRDVAKCALYTPSSLNFSRVVSSMMPSCDIELIAKEIRRAVRVSQELGESDAELENRIYNAMVREANQEDYA